MYVRDGVSKGISVCMCAEGMICIFRDRGQRQWHCE